MSSRFYFGDSASETSDTDLNDASTLPFPTPLTRTAFLQPTFDPTTYLSSLTSSPRFQTLSDLHAELKTLSSHLTTELVDLVNADYEQFLSLGASLRGGEEKVEEVRVGMMGFQRDVEGVRSWVEERGREVERLMGELREIRKERNTGRGLVEVDRRIEELEDRLGLRKSTSSADSDVQPVLSKDAEDEWDDWGVMESTYDTGDSEEETEDGGVQPKVSRRVEEYRAIRLLSTWPGQEHPFLLNQRDRLFKIRTALLAELEGAMRKAEDDDTRKSIIGLRLSLDEDLSQKS